MMTPRVGRREALQHGVAAALGSLWATQLWSQDNAPPLEPLNRYGRMLHEWYADQMRSAATLRQARWDQMRTADDATAYVSTVKSLIRQAFGRFPEKTPLNPRISGVIQRDGYTIEKVVFESRPEFYVTANLYLPQGGSTPRPGVIGSCGHSTNGKAAEAYQSFSQGLARQGIVVLIFDPIGQGERFQYPTADALKSTVGPGVLEHLHVGNPQFLLGEFFGSWRAWDGIRALDYLLTRPEVDPAHIGLTGNSGGGTMTMWLAGLEDRWTMAAPSCAVTSFHRNFHNELPTDTEQCPPQVLALGLDHGDFLAALAPKPVIILAQERDFFDIRGAVASYEQLKRLWTLLGAPDNLQLHIGPDPHGYSQSNREAMYRFFHQQTETHRDGAEPPLMIEKDETLWVMPRGQVVDFPSQTVGSLSTRHAEQLQQQRPPLPVNALQAAIRTRLKLTETNTTPEFRILRDPGRRRYPQPQATVYAVETEPGIEALVTRLYDRAHQSRPPRSDQTAVLYVSHHSADHELRDMRWLRDRLNAAADGPIYACDLRGIGESRPNTCGGPEMFLNPYGSDYFYAAHGLMLDRPLVGQRTYDLLRVLTWIGSFGHPQVEVISSGWGTIPATFAAMLTPQVTRITLHQSLSSYADVIRETAEDWPLSLFVPGVLHDFDLPDCYAALGDRLEQLV
jgi:dienelactone hydrolase